MRTKPLAAAFCGLTAILLAGGCSTTPVDVAYRAPAAAAASAKSGRALVAVGRFKDERGEDANYLGVVRSGYGTPLKTLTTKEPVGEVVRQAFADGLAARGLGGKAGKAPYVLTGTVRSFGCDQYLRREADAKVEVSLVEAATGRKVMTRTFEDKVVNGSLLTLAAGPFGSVDELRGAAAEALRHVVDKALDDRGFKVAAR